MTESFSQEIKQQKGTAQEFAFSVRVRFAFPDPNIDD